MSLGRPKHPAETHALHMEARLRHLGATLDLLVARAEAAGGEVAVEYREGVADLREKIEVAYARIKTLRSEGNENWNTVRVGVENAWRELEAALKKIADD